MVDSVKLVIDVLAEALAVPVSSDMPAERPEQYVMVSLIGGSATPYLQSPRISLTCWGKNDFDAHGTAMSAVDALWDAAIDHPLLSNCSLESMSRDEWTRNGRSRYVATLELTINCD